MTLLQTCENYKSDDTFIPVLDEQEGLDVSPPLEETDGEQADTFDKQDNLIGDAETQPLPRKRGLLPNVASYEETMENLHRAELLDAEGKWVEHAVPPRVIPPECAEIPNIDWLLQADKRVNERLAELEPGWPAVQLLHFIDVLANQVDLSQATPAMREQFRHRLNTRLKELGYKAVNKKEWADFVKANKQAANEVFKSVPAAEGHIQSELYGFSVENMRLPNAHEALKKHHDPNYVSPPSEAFDTMGIVRGFGRDAKILTNFDVIIDDEVTVHDDLQGPTRVLNSRIVFCGRDYPVRLTADVFTDDKRLRAALVQAAGTGLIINCKMDLLRQAISALNNQPGKRQAKTRTVSTDFGWAKDGTVYRVPSGVITAEGYQPAEQHGGMGVDLAQEELARQLDLRPSDNASILADAKKHIVEDLLKLHDRRVTYSLLGTVGVAVLSRFAEAFPYALWLQGLTGAGKSYIAKLFANFFGRFPVGSAQFGSWSATANYLQRQGYFHKDALYLIDDYKPDIVNYTQVIRLLQNYADGTGRGRLKSDATTNTSRPIRGLLVSTGEDLPEHAASALARNIVVRVPQLAQKDYRLAHRCTAQSRHYQCVTADFIQTLLAKKRTTSFARKVVFLERYFYQGIEGQQNDSRIASNFAVLAAGFYEMARYLGDVWPNWRKEARQFITEDLRVIRDQMVGAVKEQQPSQVFWNTLSDLVQHQAVGLSEWQRDKGQVVVGKGKDNSSDLVYVNAPLALAEVNKALHGQGRPQLRVTTSTLLSQLHQDGRLVAEDGQPLLASEKLPVSKQVRGISKGVAVRAFLTRKSWLSGTEEVGPADEPESQNPDEGIVWGPVVSHRTEGVTSL